ncbi:hypothetical protein K438DRAFT_236304 [Mycena galopus ATCC 62051]|nr:hypothetical protein K438DRAFT_236304 [Mycena galopus ATCC 62051]
MSAPPLNSRPLHMPAPPLPTPACRHLERGPSHAPFTWNAPRPSTSHVRLAPQTHTYPHGLPPPAFEPHATHFTLKAHKMAHLATPALYFAPPATPSPAPPSPLLRAQFKHPRTHTPRTTLSVARSVVGHPFPSRIDARGTRMPAVPPVARTLVTHANRTCTHPVATLAHASTHTINARTPRAPTPVAPTQARHAHLLLAHPRAPVAPPVAPTPVAPTRSFRAHALCMHVCRTPRVAATLVVHTSPMQTRRRHSRCARTPISTHSPPASTSADAALARLPACQVESWLMVVGAAPSASALGFYTPVFVLALGCPFSDLVIIIHAFTYLLITCCATILRRQRASSLVPEPQ